MDERCYYDNDQCLYLGGLWQCKTCKEWFCCYHGHTTSKGIDVECVACEYIRKGEEDNDE